MSDKLKKFFQKKKQMSSLRELGPAIASMKIPRQKIYREQVKHQELTELNLQMKPNRQQLLLWLDLRVKRLPQVL